MSHRPTDSHDVSYLRHKIALLESQLEEIRLQSRVLLDIGRALNASLDKQIIATNIISAIVSLIGIDRASVCLYLEKTNDFEVIGVFDSGTLSPQLPSSLDLSFLLEILSEGVTYYQPPQGPQDWEWICCLPLQNSHRKIGTINIHAIRQSEITSEQMKFLETVAGHASSALENSLLYTMVERDSITDGLTGIYNHRYFQKRLSEHISLSQRCKRSAVFGLLMIDVDNFKLFNDQYGHQFGDIVLKTIVQGLLGNLREEDLIARYGGEEFVVLLPETTERIVLLVSEKIRNVVEKTKILYPPTHEYVSITASIGATLWHPSDLPSSIISRADQALYKAKKTGRNQIVFE